MKRIRSLCLFIFLCILSLFCLSGCSMDEITGKAEDAYTTTKKEAESDYDSQHPIKSTLVKIPLIGGLVNSGTGYSQKKNTYATNKATDAYNNSLMEQTSDFFTEYGLYILIGIVILIVIIVLILALKKGKFRRSKATVTIQQEPWSASASQSRQYMEL